MNTTRYSKESIGVNGGEETERARWQEEEDAEGETCSCHEHLEVEEGDRVVETVDTEVDALEDRYTHQEASQLQ